MRFVRVRGAVAAGVAAVVVSIAGCGSGGDGTEAGGEESPSASVSPEVVSTAPATQDVVPEYPPGPAGEIDRRADEEGWAYDSLYGSAGEFVDDICVSLPDEGQNWSRPQWLVEGGHLAGDGAAILKFGVPKLCPKWSKTVSDAVSGNYDRWIGSSEYVVTEDPAPYDPDAELDRQEIGPGEYRGVSNVSDCYWERTRADGTIVDNQFVTQATGLTVTLRAGELFKNDCGSFRPVN